MRRIPGRLMTAVLVGSVLASLTGCKPSDSVRQAGKETKAEGPAVRPQSAPLNPVTLGSVSGTVHFAGKPPQRVKIDMSMDPVCSMMGGDNLAEQYVVHDGKLANVYVYVKDGPAVAMSAGPQTTSPVVMDQVGCRYVPHVIALMRGGSVEFRNSDSTMHNIHTMPTVVGNETVDVSQGPKGAPQQKQFEKPEVMIPVRCNNHPWMNAFINVSATPFFAVTDEKGHFEIKGLPAGTYTLAVVHEKMGEQTMSVTVAPKKAEKADFSYSMK
ncbi:MAG TPA: carboxypeptidase regulatory-like domain-containing protein [Edaphobacter sp.]|nr:carboxypeptidase regulatory-like domain-containing protein [Edaphobacter sp.]